MPTFVGRKPVLSRSGENPAARDRTALGRINGINYFSVCNMVRNDSALRMATRCIFLRVEPLRRTPRLWPGGGHVRTLRPLYSRQHLRARATLRHTLRGVT